MPGQTIKENITTRVLLFSFWQTERKERKSDTKNSGQLTKFKENVIILCISSSDKFDIEATGANKPFE